MKLVQGRLSPKKPARELYLLTDQSLSYCEKVLSGKRRENLDLIVDLLRSEMGREVLFALMGDASPAWFSKYRKQLDVNRVRRQLAESQRTIEALQADMAE